jgi:hypothetical protein
MMMIEFKRHLPPVSERVSQNDSVTGKKAENPPFSAQPHDACPRRQPPNTNATNRRED